MTSTSDTLTVDTLAWHRGDCESSHQREPEWITPAGPGVQWLTLCRDAWTRRPPTLGQHPGQGSGHRAVSPSGLGRATRRRSTATLVPQDLDLCVLCGVTPGQEHQPAEHPDHGQVDETDEYERGV